MNNIGWGRNSGRYLFSLLSTFVISLILFFPAVPAAQLADRDRDGLTDAYEGSIGTDPFDADSDNDGMDDGWEDAYGTDPLVDDASVDEDGDGLSNLGEYLMGADPQAPDSDAGGVDDGGEAGWGSDPVVDHDDDTGPQTDTVGSTANSTISYLVAGNIYLPNKDTVLMDFDQYMDPPTYFYDSVGGNSVTTYGYNVVGNKYLADIDTVLLYFRQYLDATAGASLTFYVYEGAALAGPYDLIASSTITASGGLLFYSSGTLNAEITAGNYYYLAVGFPADQDYIFDDPPSYTSSPVSFGTYERGAYQSTFPPPSTGFSPGDISRDFYQRIYTEAQVTFYVYESTSVTGTYNLLYSNNYPFESFSAGFFNSGMFGVPMQSGYYYFVGVGMPDNMTKHYLNSALPWSVSFGTLERRGYLSSTYPPTDPETFSTSTSFGFHQRVNTHEVGGLPKNVAILRNSVTWNTSPDQLLASLSIPYSVYGSALFGSVDLSVFDKIFVYSYQTGAFYTALENNTAWIENWVRSGGDFEFHGYDLSEIWFGNNVIPTGIEGPNNNFSSTYDIVSPAHYAVSGIADARLDGISSRGSFNATGGPRTDVVLLEGSTPSKLTTFDFGGGHVSATTIAVEYAANPASPQLQGPQLLRNMLLDIDRPQNTCPVSGDYIFSNTSSWTADIRSRGNIYSVSAPTILDRFYVYLNPPASEVLYFGFDQCSGRTGLVRALLYGRSVGAGQILRHGRHLEQQHRLLRTIQCTSRQRFHHHRP
jgi:hypothetical protein